MKKNLKSKILLCLLAGGVLAANTVMAAEYNTPLLGSEDAIGVYDNIRANEGKEYIYKPVENGELKVEAQGVSGDYSKNAYGIVIFDKNAENTDRITILNKLNIDISGNGGNNAAGIFITGDDSKHKIIDRSAGGNIVVNEVDKFQANAYGIGIKNGSDNQILVGDSNLEVNATGQKVNSYGLFAQYDNNKIFMNTGTIISNAITNAESYSDSNTITALGITVFDSSEINTKDIGIKVTGLGNEYVRETLVNGINAEWGGTVNTGNGDINVHGIGGNAIYTNGVLAYDGGNVTKTGGNITAIAEGEGTLAARGILANSGTVDIGVSDVTAKAIGGSTENNNWIEVIGLVGWDNGVINYAGGTITTTADNKDAYVATIHAQDNANININKDSNNKVVINGDVNNYGNGAINLNLNTADSVLNGGVYDANGTFNLANSAQWNVLGESTVNNFNVDNGIINMSTANSVNIENYSGNGIVSFQAEDVASDGVMVLNTGNIEINQATQGSNITLGVANNSINTLDVEKTEENLNAVANKVFYTANDGKVNGQVRIQEGLITPEASGVLLFDANNQGYVANITGGDRTTETMYAMKNLAATAIVAWRQEDSTLSQRLGELRDSEDGQGIWVRMSRGEFEYDGEYKNQYNFFQMGYDWAADDWHYGAAISHNDGQTTYTYGDGENRSTSLSLYGTWLGDKGQYADIVLKQGRLSNDFDVYTIAGHTSGDYDAWGTSLSGEYGQKIALEDDWYVTPQAQLRLMRIGGEDYTTNNGINVHQDTLHSAVGRLGFELGKKIADKGSVYAKASLLHDFAGNAETYLSYNGFSNSYSQDIGDTWCEAGIGFNYKTGENSYVYADVVKTFGGDVETPWQWNAGMRWSF